MDMNLLKRTQIAGLFCFSLISCNQDLFRRVGPLPDNASWMTARIEKLGNRPINTILFPGSHDADSSQIGYFSPVCKGEISPWIALAGPTGVPAAYSNTQGVAASMAELAKVGIRFFDMRVCAQGGKYWGAHGLISAPIFDEKLLGGLLQFAKDHPQELFFLRFQEQGSEIREWDVSAEFGKEFEGEFAEVMVPPAGLSPTSTLNEVLAQGNLIAVWGLPSPVTRNYWSAPAMPFSWPNTLDVDTVIERELAAIHRRPAGTFFVSYLDLTPTEGFILKNLASSVIAMEVRMNEASLEWFLGLAPDIKSKFNIIAFDAVIFDFQLVEAIFNAND